MRYCTTTALVFGWLVWLQASKHDLDMSRPAVAEQWLQVTKDSSYETLAECNEALAVQADAFEFVIKNRAPEAKRHGAAVLSHDGTYLHSLEFFCFNDTMDPRGAKSK